MTHPNQSSSTPEVINTPDSTEQPLADGTIYAVRTAEGVDGQRVVDGGWSLDKVESDGTATLSKPENGGVSTKEVYAGGLTPEVQADLAIRYGQLPEQQTARSEVVIGAEEPGASAESVDSEPKLYSKEMTQRMMETIRHSAEESETKFTNSISGAMGALDELNRNNYLVLSATTNNLIETINQLQRLESDSDDPINYSFLTDIETQVDAIRVNFLAKDEPFDSAISLIGNAAYCVQTAQNELPDLVQRFRESGDADEKDKQSIEDLLVDTQWTEQDIQDKSRLLNEMQQALEVGRSNLSGMESYVLHVWDELKTSVRDMHYRDTRENIYEQNQVLHALSDQINQFAQREAAINESAEQLYRFRKVTKTVLSA